MGGQGRKEIHDKKRELFDNGMKKGEVQWKNL
jgi:hypothetical protein